MTDKNTDSNTKRQKSLYHITTNRELSAKILLQQGGTVPFTGLTEPTSYPDEININPYEDDHRFDTESPMELAVAMRVLPEASKVETYGRNKFISVDDNGETNVKIEKIRELNGINTDEIESEEGKSLQELAEDANPEEVLHIPDRKIVCDDRRQALRNLGYEVKYTWKIGSNTYTPLEVRKFFDRKIEVLQENGIFNAFGWVRHRKWGGHVTANIIYPSERRGISEDGDNYEPPSSGDNTPMITKGENELDHDESSGVAYFGEQIRYSFDSSSRLTVKPIVYFPDDDLMIPLQPLDGKESLKRKQMGSINDDISKFHQNVIDDIREFAREIDETIMNARRLAIDFDETQFTMEEFFEYLGIGNTDYIEETVDRVKEFASPPSQPSIWNLQLNLKRTILEECRSDKAADTYQAYQEYAGQLLQDPKPTLVSVMATHQKRVEKERRESKEEQETDNDQPKLSEFGLSDIEGVTENDMSASQAEKAQNMIDSRLEE